MEIKVSGEKLIAISLYLLIFYLCLPFSMVILNSPLIRLLVVASAGLFVTGMIILNKRKYLFVFFILFAFTFFYWRITWSVQLNTLVYVYYSFASLLFVFAGMTLYFSGNSGLLRRLFLFMTVLYLVTAITSIIGLRAYPFAAREMGRGATYNKSLDFDTYKNIYRRMNIVGWSQVYGMLFAIPASLMVWKKKRETVSLISLIAITVMLVASQITFALLLAVALIVVTFMNRKNASMTILIMLAFAVIAILILLNLEDFLTAVIALTEKAGFRFLVLKLNDMKILLLEGSAVGDADSRGTLYLQSIRTFLRYPVSGLMFRGKANLNIIGYHSEFFDLLGAFGLIGLFVVVASFVGYFRFLGRIENESRKDLTIIYLAFIGLFILNPVFNSPQIFVGAFLYPLLASRYCAMNDGKIDL